MAMLALCAFIIINTVLISCVYLSAQVVSEEGYSTADGSEFEAESPFTHTHYSDESRDYAVFDETRSDLQLPIIVWWTNELFPHFGGTNEKYVVQCGKWSCYTTQNRKYAKKKNTRGFIFYGTDVDPENLPLPRRRYHEWALFHEESPLNNYILSHKPFLELFNHTATFRNESDFPLTTQNIYYIDYLTERQPVSLSVKNKLRKTFAPVLYVQSHCDVPSDRDRYVKELMKYIDVDSYGECLHNKDLPKHLTDPAENFEKEEFLRFIAQYKFHLAFENANCKDYMTEKLMRPLYVGAVPIYRGSPNAEEWMPSNHSVIMVDNFLTPKDLAEYIKKIDADDAEYEKYIDYKRTGITNDFLRRTLHERTWHVNQNGGFDYFRDFECHVCKKINERMAVELVHKQDPSVPLLPPKMADKFHLGCPQPYPSIGDPGDIPKSDKWHTTDWIETYWKEYDRARAVKMMILAKEKNANKFSDYLKQATSRN